MEYYGEDADIGAMEQGMPGPAPRSGLDWGALLAGSVGGRQSKGWKIWLLIASFGKFHLPTTNKVRANLI